MRVPVVQVRVMRVPVHQPRVPVPVRMRFARRRIFAMLVLVVFVVAVTVLVLQLLMHMLVLMPLRQVQPEAKAHERARDQQPGGQRLAEERHPDRGTHEGGEGEIRAGSGGAEMAQRQHEAHPVAEEAYQPGRREQPRRLGPGQAQHRTEGVDGGEPKPGAEVEQPGHHPGAHCPEQEFGERRTGAEQDGREKGEHDASAEHGGTLDQPHPVIVGCGVWGAPPPRTLPTGRSAAFRGC